MTAKPPDEARNRVLRDGVRPLRVDELIAAVLGNGTRGREAADRLLRRYDGDLVRIGDESPQALAQIIGIGPVQAAQLAAAFELARRWAQFSPATNPIVRRASDVAAFLSPFLRGEQQEHLYVLCLNTKNIITNHRALFSGSLNASIIHPREVFRFALENSAASIVLAHNHPSGDPAPSPEDIAITKRLVESGKALDVPVLDHVVLGEKSYRSMKEDGIIGSGRRTR
ncbi:DNA repair protein RadC [Candidatus Poribacteria bacterium]|nr:DNA repair protein RadC [Candidatus Poribacteria bacterium]